MLYAPQSVEMPFIAILHNAGSAIWRHRYLVVAGVLIAAGLAYAGIRFLLGPIVDVAPVIRADLIQSVVASGNVLAPYRVNIGSQIVGIVADVPVEEGQTVRTGDTLVVLDDREARAAVVQTEGAVAQAEARLRQLREVTLPSSEQALAEANATLLNAQQAHDRAEALAKSGYGTRVALDDATKALDIARAQARSAEFQVFTNRPGGSDYVMAETQLNQARANLATANSRLSYTVIKAPRDGILISRNVERGNIVQPSNVLMVLSPSGDTQLVVQIDEKNLGLIGLGQKAVASADAYPKESFAAEVAYINPGVDLQRASVEVKLRVSQPPAYLRQDMTVSVDIETRHSPNALIVPATAVHISSSNHPWVLKIEKGRAAKQDIKLGIFSAGKAEIIEGLQEGNLVVQTSGVAPGSRVRASIRSDVRP